MTDKELNKRLCEIMHKPLAEWRHFEFTNTWTGFGIMWEFMKKHDQWEEFMAEWGYDVPTTWFLPIELISPRHFAVAMYEFFIGSYQNMEQEGKP